MSNVYIAGPIRNRPNCNREMFDKVARELRALNHFVFNPIEQDDLWDNHPHKPNFSIRKALAIDTDFICQQCDLMVMLPDWYLSRGAVAEHALAIALDIPIKYWEFLAD